MAEVRFRFLLPLGARRERTTINLSKAALSSGDMAAATMQYTPLIGETTAAEASAEPPRSASKLSGTDIERQERGIHAVELAGPAAGRSISSTRERTGTGPRTVIGTVS